MPFTGYRLVLLRGNDQERRQTFSYYRNQTLECFMSLLQREYNWIVGLTFLAIENFFTWLKFSGSAAKFMGVIWWKMEHWVCKLKWNKLTQWENIVIDNLGGETGCIELSYSRANLFFDRNDKEKRNQMVFQLPSFVLKASCWLLSPL